MERGEDILRVVGGAVVAYQHRHALVILREATFHRPEECVSAVACGKEYGEMPHVGTKARIQNRDGEFRLEQYVVAAMR